MKTLGVYGPKPVEQSAVASYIALSLPALSKYFDCVHVSRYDTVDPDHFDYVLYHLSANVNSRHSHAALRQRAGPVIVHEHNCLEFYYTIWDDLTEDYRKRIISLFSKKFGRFFKDLAEAQAFADETPGMDRYNVDIGVEAIFMEQATAAITHSPFIRDLLQVRYPQTHIEMVPLMAAPFTSEQVVWARKRLGLHPDDLVFGMFGRIGEYKRAEQVIHAWQQWNDRPLNAKLLILGKRQYAIDIPVSNNMIYMDYVVDDGEFDAFLATADCAVQLRYPTLGETSGVVSKMIANNKRLIISDTPYTAHYQQYPNIIRVRPDSDEIQNLLVAFRQIAQLPRLPMIYDSAYSPASCTSRWAEIILSYSINHGDKK